MEVHGPMRLMSIPLLLCLAPLLAFSDDGPGELASIPRVEANDQATDSAGLVTSSLSEINPQAMQGDSQRNTDLAKEELAFLKANVKCTRWYESASRCRV